MRETDNGLTWDLETLVMNILIGTEEALKRFPDIISFSVDSWGVDYVLMQGDREILPCYAYRDTVLHRLFRRCTG